jgi:hypothetical protein
MNSLPVNSFQSFFTKPFFMSAKKEFNLFFMCCSRFDCVDQKGYNAIFLMLASLNPKETLPFILTNAGSTSATLQFPTKIFIKVSDFSKEPSKMMSRSTNHGKEAGISFKPLENVKLQAVGVRTARARST